MELFVRRKIYNPISILAGCHKEKFLKYELKRSRIDRIPRDELLDELERVAEINDYVVFGKRDFAKSSKFSAGPVVSTFGGWDKAIAVLHRRLQDKGIELKPRSRVKYSDLDLFHEMERIWSLLGHRPSKTEWENSNPKISYNTYKYRFKGWMNACFAFIEYKMGTRISDASIVKLEFEKVDTSEEPVKSGKQYKSRNISYKTRYEVLKRDNFACVYCGRSPAIDQGIILHIDHIIPFSKGGSSEYDNLQTLCSQCNLGKSDDVT